MINQKNTQNNKKTPKYSSQPQEASLAHQKKDTSSENRDELGEMMKRIKEVKSLNQSIIQNQSEGLDRRDRWILNSSQNKQALIEYLVYMIIYPFFFEGTPKRFYYQCRNCFCQYETNQTVYSSPINTKSLFVREKDEKKIKRFKKVLCKKMRENNKNKKYYQICKENKGLIVKFLRDLKMKKLLSFIEEKLPHKNGYFQIPCLISVIKDSSPSQNSFKNKIELNFEGRKDFRLIPRKRRRHLDKKHKEEEKYQSNLEEFKEYFKKRPSPPASTNTIQKLMEDMNEDISSIGSTPAKDNPEQSFQVSPNKLKILNSAPPLRRTSLDESVVEVVSRSYEENHSQMSKLIKEMKKMSVKRENMKITRSFQRTTTQTIFVASNDREVQDEVEGVSCPSSQRNLDSEVHPHSSRKSHNSLQKSQIEFLTKLRDQKRRQAEILLSEAKKLLEDVKKLDKEADDMDFQIDQLRKQVD